MMCYTTGRQTEREIHKQITRQIDQEVVELSMQRITAVTSCDHRRNRRQGGRKRVTGVAREREKSKNRWEERREGGGAVESKKRIEQWRESIYPMRSIELSIMLLQPVNGSSWGDEEGSEEGRKRRQRKHQWEGNGCEGASCFSGIYLQCRMWWRTLCCNANLLSCLSSGVVCRGRKIQHTGERKTEKGRERVRERWGRQG